MNSTTPEIPSTLVSIGRGVADWWEPMKSLYLHLTNPAPASVYDAQAADGESRYIAGVDATSAQSAGPPMAGAFAIGLASTR